MPDTRRILVIDDEEIVHASIRRILSRIGYEVEGVFSAREGLDRMQANSYDVVITDLMMPEMNGIEMLETMKQKQMNIPSIMITGYPTIKTAIQALRLGAVDYIPKPFTRQELLAPLARALRRGRPSVEKMSFENTDRKDEKLLDVLPGDCFYLPEHSWARYNQDGTMDIGVEISFLHSISKITAVEAPLENDLVEQGYPGFKLKAEDEIHSVFMPISGRVFNVNTEVLINPANIDEKTWILKVVPSQLNDELVLLRRRPRC